MWLSCLGGRGWGGWGLTSPRHWEQRCSAVREWADALRDRLDWALTRGHSSLGSEEHPPCLSPDTTLLHGEHPAREPHGPWSLLVVSHLYIEASLHLHCGHRVVVTGPGAAIQGGPWPGRSQEEGEWQSWASQAGSMWSEAADPAGEPEAWRQWVGSPRASSLLGSWLPLLSDTGGSLASAVVPACNRSCGLLCPWTLEKVGDGILIS